MEQENIGDLQQKEQTENKNQQEQNEEIQYDQKLEIRESSYAGSWYSNNEHELNIQINVWLDMAKCEIQNIQAVKAIIVPHAGFSFSGPTQAYAYKYLKQYCHQKKLRVFLMGPFHYIFIRQCGLSGMKVYETPVGNIEIDQETINELRELAYFETTDKDAEEEEHSLEMQLCFLIKTLGAENIKLIPIMVGALDQSQETLYGQIFSKFVDQDDTLFIVSTDFCHWGQKYKYTYFNKDDGEIYEQIEKLDQRGMTIIEKHDNQEFISYLKETENNICGRHALSILLHAFNNSKYSKDIQTHFVRYALSSLVKDKSDQSVSYASAVSIIEDQ
ncbi:hypothetical protein IMG5_148030 [Ichthyophthirius multifiliis]|uniref:Memo family protein n=1 Tax=Ichthyophthirius multifiliis TaxID=5932 RepID=G0QY80_ICHMU|nr:hypothetical protein IMG5_148030 [Ichthyophthirius multifiliis]EGR29819.1 hypothetical protein IMG5_148030 [Ichthyophthirius multifiliis]|eukprot:XP_004031055.1 hypothetical protein IMG5_148030 [Ichthyophthirius multifiliis]